MSRRSERGEERLGDLLDTALRGLEIRREVREVRVREAFAEVVGVHAARFCNAVSLDRGTLCVATAHSGLAQQLQLDAPALIAALNARLGSAAVRRLRFVARS